MVMMIEMSKDVVGKMSRQLYGVFCLGVLIVATSWHHYYYAEEDDVVDDKRLNNTKRKITALHTSF